MPQLGQRVIQAHGLATTLALGGELSGEKGDAGLFSPDFDSEDPKVISSFIAQMVGIDLSSGNPEQQTRAHQVVGPVLGRFQTALTAREKHEKDKTSRTSRPYDRTEIDSFTTELLHSLVDAGLLDDWLQDTQVDDEAKAEFSLVEGRVWLKATMVEMLDNYANTVVPSFGETNFQGLDPKYVTGDLSRFQLLATAGISDDDEIVGFLKEKEGELDLKSLSYIWSSLMLTAAGQGNLPETPPLSYLTQIPVMGPGVHPPPWLAQPGPPPSEQYTDPSRDPHATGPLISPTYMD
jgi:hypothetical protein